MAERVLGQAVRDRPGEHRNGILPVFCFAYNYHAFGQNTNMKILIWEKRTEQNISLRQLSMCTDISKTALNSYENHTRYPNMMQMELIAKALHTTISDLYESPYK